MEKRWIIEQAVPSEGCSSTGWGSEQPRGKRLVVGAAGFPVLTLELRDLSKRLLRATFPPQKVARCLEAKPCCLTVASASTAEATW